MDKEKAEKLAIELINNNCVGYSFKWDNAKRRFGLCNWKKKIISLSQPLTLLNSEEQVKNTILHEIAHALTETGHNKRFYKMCSKLGTTPKRCYSKDVKTPKIKHKFTYIYECPTCHKEIIRNRKTRVSCGSCCDKFNNGRYSEDFKFKLISTIQND